MDATEFWYFMGFQMLALVIIFLFAFGWGIKKGEDFVVIFEAYPPFIVGLRIYGAILIIGGILTYFEVVPFWNKWFIYVGLAFCSGIFSGLAPNVDNWK